MCDCSECTQVCMVLFLFLIKNIFCLPISYQVLCNNVTVMFFPVPLIFTTIFDRSLFLFILFPAYTLSAYLIPSLFVDSIYTLFLQFNVLFLLDHSSSALRFLETLARMFITAGSLLCLHCGCHVDKNIYIPV